MDIELTKPFAGNGGADEYDVRKMKKALNRLGYYLPYDKTGITEIPDPAVFTALKSFQKDSGLRATGTAKPGDETIEALNDALAKKPEGQYIWRTVGDKRVRPEHAALDGTLRNFSDSPDPGDDFNCRCWAEPIKDAINPVHPELILNPALKIGRIIKIIRAFYKTNRNVNHTNHGHHRANQRDISAKEIQEAIKTAKAAGRVTTKTGKYGTPQNIYHGTNGVTVVEETAGRNAGKIITVWRR